MTSNATEACHLSLPKYGYDAVVSLSQASLDAIVKKYLHATKNFPVQTLCSVETKNPIYSQGSVSRVVKEHITLEALKERTNGIDPFEIDDKTPGDNHKVQALMRAGFQYAFRIQPGLPKGIAPADLPPAVQLSVDSGDANHVYLYFFFADVTIVQGIQKGVHEEWRKFEQRDSKSPWYCVAKVALAREDLPADLDTPYFRHRLDQQQEILEKLRRSPDKALQLQQLTFNLQSAEMGECYGFPARELSRDIWTDIRYCLRDPYFKSMNRVGRPVLNITAAKPSQPSCLDLTGYGHTTSLFKDAQGSLVARSPASTLDILCAANNNTIPLAPEKFDWNPMTPDEVQSYSGSAVLNRESLGQFFLDRLLPAAKQCCLKASASVHCKGWNKADVDLHLESGGTPQSASVIPTSTPIIPITPFMDLSGVDHNPTVVRISYTSEAESQDQGPYPKKANSEVKLSYLCDVSFARAKIYVTQQMVVWASHATETEQYSFNLLDKTIGDAYEIFIDEDGAIALKKDSDSIIVDKSENPSPSKFHFVASLMPVLNKIKGSNSIFASSHLERVRLPQLQEFVFPGAAVLRYDSARFSRWQDLVCGMTYIEKSFACFSMLNAQESPVLDEELATPPHQQYSLDYSTQMMQNYIQGEVICPNRKFEALQTADGRALIFTLDTEDSFQVIEERSGSTATGWEPVNLSTKAIQGTFPGNQGRVNRFDVAQNALDASISMAVAVPNNHNGDQLMVSLGNSNSLTGWIQKPMWRHIPFDGREEDTPRRIRIAKVFFTQTSNHMEYLLVDLIDNGTNTTIRYVVNPSPSTGSPSWVQHRLPMDLAPDNYQSCVGRASGAYVDGIYTSGTIDGHAEMDYVPVIDVFAHGAPVPRRFRLPSSAKGGIAPVITTPRNQDCDSIEYGDTDIYAVSENALYRYAATSQIEGALPQRLVRHDILNDTKTLRTMQHDGVTTIWGLNGNNQVYYLECQSSELAKPGSWSVPVSILDKVGRLTAYVNRADGGNTVFAVRENSLYHLIQSTELHSKMWRAHKREDNAPASDARVRISAHTRAPVYINGTYHVLTTRPIEVKADAIGVITIIEGTGSLNGTILTVSAGTTQRVINPMDQSFQKLAKLNKYQALRGASLVKETVAGGIVGTPQMKRLVRPETSDEKMRAIARSIGNTRIAYTDFSKNIDLAAKPLGEKPLPALETPLRVLPATFFCVPPKGGKANIFADEFAIAAGDLFQMLYSYHRADVEIVRDITSHNWHFVAKIGEQLYRAVLDSLDAVVAGTQWLFKAVNTERKDLNRFVEFLFEWDDIKRTKDVSKQIFSLFAAEQVDRIPDLKDEIESALKQAEQKVKNWGHLNVDSLPKNIMQKSAKANASNPNKGQTSASSLLASHFRNNVGKMILKDRVGKSMAREDQNDLKNLVDELLQVFEQEGDQFSKSYQGLRNLTHQYASMNITQVLQNLMKVVTEIAFSSTSITMTAVLGVLSKASKAAIDLLHCDVYIPVISDILEELDVHTVSFLDLFCWVAAVSYTVVYKATTEKAPFASGPDYERLVSASSWGECTQLFGTPSLTTASPLAQKRRTHSFSMAKKGTFLTPVSAETQHQVYVVLHGVSGAMNLLAATATLHESQAPPAQNEGIAHASAILSAVPVMLQCTPNSLYPREPIQDSIFEAVSSSSCVLSGLTKMLFATITERFNLGDLKLRNPFFKTKNTRGTASIIDISLLLPAIASTIEHFVELANRRDSPARTDAMLMEMQSLTSTMKRVLYAIAVTDDPASSREAAVRDMTAGNITQAGLQVSLLFVEQEADEARVQVAAALAEEVKDVVTVVKTLEVAET
ncbi:hypothetical protein BJX99DRAFT_258689 [Aspergillus californicus]